MKYTLTPSTPVQYLKGVGPHWAELLEKKAIYTAWDILFYLPIKYVDRRKLHTIQSLPFDKNQSFLAEITDCQIKFLRGRRRILEVTVSDATGVAKITFFQFHEATLKRRFPIGHKAIFFGDTRHYGAFKNMVHPEMELWDEDDSDPEAALKIVPFYSLTEGLYQKTLRGIVSKNLDDLVAMIEEDPRSVREEGVVHISLAEAFRHVHHPPLSTDMATLNAQTSPYHQRIVYDEFFYLQLGLLSKRYRTASKKSFVIQNPGSFFQKALALLPFQLTHAQENALLDIKRDFLSGKPMNRLLQGDVGSGKTMVAFLSALYAIESGFQVALMAPTEILAEQHFKNLFPFEETLGIKIELLMGSTSAKRREQILYELEQGLVHLMIGTHALLTPDVHFHRLAYVVIDEQHRFGVMQRAQLKNKSKFHDGDTMPHFLVMTATPIPRTLSLCLYGDLELTTIRELPQGRKPIVTRVFREKQRHRMYEWILDELAKGRQAYFVYPLVEESEKLDLKDATLMHQELSQVFKNHRVALLHGRMNAQEKESTMHAFKNGEIAVLVATTVVEVGVDVPNATVMVIEHAERFGLSQLHQLRGRVGRGGESSYCFLLAGYAQSEESRFRLKIMEETNDGFVIAEEDLKLRGPGEFLGTRQSGMPDFRLAHIVRDEKLLTAAKKRAEEVLQDDPNLKDSKNQRLKTIMLERWGERLELTLV